MGTEINVGGTWKSIDNCEVNVGSAWKQVEAIEINVGGTWKTVWTNETVTVSGQTIVSEFSPSTCYARVKVDNDGNIYESKDTGTPSWTQIDTATDWLRPTTNAPSDYEVRFTGLTGSALNSSTAVEDTWWPLSSGDFTLVQVRIAALGTGTTTSTFTIEIRKGSTGGALDSASYTLTCQIL